ncbi:MAG: hypothetical protein K2X82_09180 [Gemmataceae bacterium]|nr:hypothetical protein [Gemmataceae bacterium]
MQPLFAELSLRGWVPLWLAAALGVVAAAAVVGLYAREAGRLGVLPRSLMALVRLAAVAVVAFLLLRPVWVQEHHGDRRRPVAVLIDASQSMDSRDPRPNAADQARAALAFDLAPPDKGLPDGVASAAAPDKPRRAEVARAALTNPRLDLFERLKTAAGPLEVSTFGSRRTGRETGDLTWLKELTGTEPQTALADAALELVGRDPNDLPAGVVVVTDGRENASRRSLDDLARECDRLKVPLHVYGVGSSAFGQLQLRDVAVPDTLFVDDTVSVPVRYGLAGVAGGRAEVVVRYGGREVARRIDDPITPGENVRQTLSFVPTKADAAAARQELTVTVTVTSGTGANAEVLTDELTKPVRVVDKKLKVLVVDSLPRFDFRYLQRALLRDRRVEPRFYLTEADRSALRSGKPWVAGFAIGRDDFRKELFEYDLLILGDLPGSFWTPDQQEVIREFVAEGGGLIHLAGRAHAPGAWAKGPLADVLPVEVDPVRFPVEAARRPAPFRPQVAPAAARSPVLAMEDDPAPSSRVWRALPPMYWFQPVAKLKPAAEVLLTHPEKNLADGKPMPLLAGHYYGKGYVIFAGFDETWRWRFNEADKYFGRFWSQAVYAAGVPRTAGTKLTQLSLDATDPVQGKTGQLFARLFNKDFKPVTADEVEGRLRKTGAGPDDKDADTPVKLTAVRGPDGQPTGEYVATLPFGRTGRFALSVQGDREDPGTLATLDYRVSLPPDHELAPGPMAEAELRRLAEATGGAFYREEDLHKLPDAVKPQYVPVVTRTETVLWNRWAMIVLVGLLTVEWVVRKFNGLS